MSVFKVSELAHCLHLDFFAPAAGNAMGLEVARELTSIRKQFLNLTKPLVLSSAHPRLFCSGGNLSDYKKLKGKAPGLTVNREIERHLREFGRWRVVKLAVIEGDCLGGGMEWLAQFDVRWSTPHAYFAFWQRRIGLSTGWGGGRQWAKKIGEERVRRLLTDAQLLTATEALKLGLIDGVYSTWKIRDLIAEWAERMDSPTALRLNRWSGVREGSLFESQWMGAAHRAALAKW